MSAVDAAAELLALKELTAELEHFVDCSPGSAEGRPERMRRLLAQLGSPQDAYECVHVGGTSGKGSISALTAAVLTAHGVRTGLHLSPFVQVLTETWQLDGRNVLPSRALPVARELRAAAGELRDGTEGPAYFEAKVALALLLFQRARVGRAVVEVGMGGRLDATNVLEGGVKVLANVGLDHTDQLGPTVEAIAREKIGIFRPGSTVVSGVTQPAVRDLVIEECRRLGLRLSLVDDSLSVDATPRGLRLREQGRAELLVHAPPEWQRYQQVNAALALVAARETLGRDLDPELCAAAIAGVRLPARVERLSTVEGEVVLDGAHNADKIAAALTSISAAYPGRRLVGVVALKTGKQVEPIVRRLLGSLSEVVFTSFDAPPWTCVPPAHLTAVAAGPTAQTCEDPSAALARARELAGREGVVVVTGSLFLAGNLRHRWVSDPEALLSGGSYGSVGGPA